MLKGGVKGISERNRIYMKQWKKYLNEIFIDGLSGMASGLFATLIIGTIIQQIGSLIPGAAGSMLFMMGKFAAAVTGAGIGCGAAIRLKADPLLIISSGTAGMAGAFASKILAGTVLIDGAMVLQGPGEPLGAFIAAMVCIYIGRIVSGRTKVDILVTPLVCIVSGSSVGLILGPPISAFMTWLGSMINWGTEQAPFLMGIVVSVLMGMILTLPISSAALGIILGLNGIAAGAATVGCCANMIGFATASFRENKVNGLLAQGLGTSMLQMGNIVKNPRIWIPPTLASAITGPIATCVFALKMNGPAVSSGMGTCGLVGQIGVYTGWLADMESGLRAGITSMDWIGLILICFVLPALLSVLFCRILKKAGWIKENDLKLS